MLGVCGPCDVFNGHFAMASERVLAGERPPLILGASSAGRFYSPDVQAGRPVVLASLGLECAQEARRRLARLQQAAPQLRELGVDLIALAPHRRDFLGTPSPTSAEVEVVHVVDPAALAALEVQAPFPLLALDPAGRVVFVGPFAEDLDLLALVLGLRPAFHRERPVVRGGSAPVLILPNLLSPTDCAEAMARFEASPYTPGKMAALAQGASGGVKVDEGKKRRWDFELQPGDPVHTRLLAALRGCAPEIARAYNCDIAFADRILLARYDVGGRFRRHRDNVAPQTRFREFAVSINLNTGAYEGGELSFPEYDDHLYSPPAGGALIFSASLLHEALPVRQGSRYVALSFLSSAAGAAKMQAA